MMCTNGGLSVSSLEVPNVAACHRIFSIGDILDHICLFASGSGLCALVSTSRRFYESAIRKLYHRCDYLILNHLLRIIISQQPTVKLPVQKTGERWDRFTQYMKHVRHLDLSRPSYLRRFHETFTQIIADNGSPILPSLRTLQVEAGTTQYLGDYEFVLALLRATHPSLWKISLSYGNSYSVDLTWSESLISILDSLPTCCPELRCLLLKCPTLEVEESIRPSLTAAFGHLEGLEELEIQVRIKTQRAVLRGITNLRTLKTLRVDDHSVQHTISVPQKLPSGLPYLCNLQLRIPSSLLTALASSCSSCDLMDISISTWVVGSSSFYDDIHAFSKLLPAFPQLIHVDFRIVQSGVPSEENFRPDNAWDALTPAVFLCTHMRFFRYTNSAETPLKERHIRAIALSWPELRSLELLWCMARTAHPSPGLQAVAALQSHCLHLQSLLLGSLGVSRGDICVMPGSMSAHAIDFGVGVLYLDDAHALASLLVASWARVNLVPLYEFTPSSASADQKERWIELMVLVKALRGRQQLEHGYGRQEEVDTFRGPSAVVKSGKATVWNMGIDGQELRFYG